MKLKLSFGFFGKLGKGCKGRAETVTGRVGELAGRFRAETLTVVLPSGWTVLDQYPIDQALVQIVEDERGRGLYLIHDPPLSKEEHTVYSILMENIFFSLKPLAKVEDPLRFRPDYIVVGEVRGEEIVALNQAALLGHGCLTTFHAESPEAALARLRVPPLNVPEGHLLVITCFAMTNRVQLHGGTWARRCLEIAEIEPKESNGTVRAVPRRIFEWNPRTDTFTPDDPWEVVKRSYKFNEVKRITGWTDEELAEELRTRAEYLQRIVEEGKLKFNDFTHAIEDWYIQKRRKMKGEA